MRVRLNGTEGDLTSYEGEWNADCVERIEGEDAVLSIILRSGRGGKWSYS